MGIIKIICELKPLLTNKKTENIENFSFNRVMVIGCAYDVSNIHRCLYMCI
jgi:hypothetical protein